MEIFNARTQKVEKTTWSKDANGEIVATFEDETFIKFPAGSTKAEIESLVVAHQEANEGQEVITPEMEEEAAKAEEETDELLDQLNADTTAESDKTNASTDEGFSE